MPVTVTACVTAGVASCYEAKFGTSLQIDEERRTELVQNSAEQWVHAALAQHPTCCFPRIL